MNHRLPLPAEFHRPRRVALASLALVFAATARSIAGDEPGYNREIRPILAENCFACHGPDSAARKADLRLDKRDAAISSLALVPGKATESEAIRRILSNDPDQVMPPPSANKRLTDRQKQLIADWVDQGATYEAHWSLIAPRRPAPPPVKGESWVRTPIDRFVLARLEAAGLQPAPEADRRTMVRRLALDLTGLPPAPELVDEFVGDPADNAYEKLVDRLLESPHWGEHRARYWLDVARYADTHGIHFDNFREIWAYRDWVIRALNRNLPFDQFTIEQLAGDLLPNRSLEQLVATGFNRCNITTNEGGTIPEEYYVLYTRDRTETVAQVWMGLTAGCAVCHDHKFDPLTMRDFYGMAAFFNNTTQNAMDGNIKDTAPIVSVPSEEDRPRFEALDRDIPAVRDQIETRRKETRPNFDAWLATATPDAIGATLPKEKLALHAELKEGQGKVTRVVVRGAPRDVQLADSAKWIAGVGSQALEVQGTACDVAEAGDYEKDQPFSLAAWVRLPPNDSFGAIASRMDKGPGYRGWDFWVQGRRIGTHLVSSWPDDGLKVVSEAQVPGNQWTHVAVTYDGSTKASGVRIFHNGQLQKNLVENDRLQGTIKTSVPFRVGQRSAGEPLSGAGIQDLRIYERALTDAEVMALARATRFAGILAKAAGERTDAEKDEVYPWWLGSFDESYQQAAAKLTALEQEQAAVRARGTVAHVMNEKQTEAMAFLLTRGEYDKRGDPVQPSTPASLPAMSAELPRNRLGFARWLLTEEHPLTARVTVNRFWQELFGTGLVKTAGDFGVTGELPSHPDLLDWLAVDFREHGWDIKRFFKQIVMSNAYRQAGVVTPEKVERDPQNRLLSRGPRFRMDAEMVRDYSLAASGLLVPKLGGPSVKPYQPEGVWEAVAMIGSNTRDYRRDSNDSLYRRSMYTFWKRSAPPASMEIFNATNRETCTVRRERTNTPLQALVTLNDVQFVEAARHLAQQALTRIPGDDTDARVDFIARRLLARSFQPSELVIVKRSLADLGAYYDQHADDARALVTQGDSKPDASIPVERLATWTMLVNELMNLDEVLTK